MGSMLQMGDHSPEHFSSRAKRSLASRASRYIRASRTGSGRARITVESVMLMSSRWSGSDGGAGWFIGSELTFRNSTLERVVLTRVSEDLFRKKSSEKALALSADSLDV